MFLGEKQVFERSVRLRFSMISLIGRNGVHVCDQLIGMAGIGNGALNMIFSNVEPSRRMQAYALQQCVAGAAGFIVTTLVSLRVSHIQQSGNVFLGLHVYAQQVVSAIGFLITAGILLYLNFGVLPERK